MKRFSGWVQIEPDGYEWIEHGRKMHGIANEDAHAASICLAPLRRHAILEELEGEGTWEEGATEVLVRMCGIYDAFDQEPALYRIFARLEPSETDVLEFANCYGDLADIDEAMEEMGSTLLDWKTQIAEMNHLIQEGDKLILGGRQNAPSASHRRKVVAFVNHLIDAMPTEFKARELNGSIAFDTKTFGLMNTMKLQLVDSILEPKTYRDCEHCSRPFEVSPQVNRTDRLYCSDNCRVKAYQRRRKQAIQMRGDGDTLREIAKALGSDMSTIKKWVGETNKEK